MLRLFVFAAAGFVAGACASEAPSIVLAGPSAIEVRHLPDTAGTLRVNVGEQLTAEPPVAGRIETAGGMLRFVPLYPLEPGRAYFVRFEGDGLRVEAVVRVPPGEASPAVRVTRVFPDLDNVPENLLRLYIHFSGRMGRDGAVPHVKLIDAQGAEVIDPFLPVEGEFWSPDHTRYTLFFDPGRVKTGILPNERMGRPLRQGQRYTLVILPAWKDAQGRPLAEEFRRTFTVGPPLTTPLTPAAWTLHAPAAGTRDPFVVTFPHAFDNGLLQRALSIERDGTRVEGTSGGVEGDRRWSFTPARPWAAAPHQLVVLSILEDPSGNRIGRAFEVEGATRGPAGPDRHLISWSPRQ